jgi:hypothetical protein
MPKDMGLPYGPYPLTSQGVTNNVLSGSPGAYALGKRGDDGVFYIDYVGRADEDIANRLYDHVTETSPQFHFTYCISAEAAYLKECQLYHDFPTGRNIYHPAKPKGSNRKCPVCLV